jgi:histidinol-phosphate phosphatase family protein
MKAIFLDRDGVINKYPGDRMYVTSWKTFKFLPGAKKALKKLKSNSYWMFVISNQAGVSKGVYPRKNLDEITANMQAELKKYGAQIDAVYYCTHRDEDNCRCRKPKAGLIKKACQEFGLSREDLKQSYFIGDTIRDVQTAKNAGCKSILVFSGKERKSNMAAWESVPNLTADNLSKAADLVLKRGK